MQFMEANFDGQAGASVLVPSLITANALQRNQLCHLEQSLCSSNADPRSGLLVIDGSGTNVQENRNPSFNRARDDAKETTTSRIGRARTIGMESIERAITTDEFTRRFPRSIGAVVQVYGLQRIDYKEGRAVVAFALSGDELAYTVIGNGDARAVYPVRVQLMVARRGDGVRFDLDTVRRFATPMPLRKGQFLSGLVELPLPPGTYAVSVALAQDDRGALAKMNAVAIPTAGRGLSISDLVLGREGSGVKWQSGESAVPLNPLNSYQKGGAAEIYFQVGGLSAGDGYQSRIQFFGADDPPTKAAQVAISSSARASGPRDGSYQDARPRSTRRRPVPPAHHRIEWLGNRDRDGLAQRDGPIREKGGATPASPG